MKPVEELEGRELDAAVASEVMDLNVVHHKWPQGRTPSCGVLEAKTFLSPDEANELWAETESWWQKRGPVYIPDHPHVRWPPERWDGAHTEDRAFHTDVRPVPLYSKYIEEVWDVVEQGRLKGLREVGWDDGRAETKPPAWEAHLSFPPDSINAIVCRGYGDTPPTAICRAALKAVREYEGR